MRALFLAQLRLPARCLELLRLILDVLLRARGLKGLRSEMYAVLLQYLQVRWAICDVPHAPLNHCCSVAAGCFVVFVTTQ